MAKRKISREARAELLDALKERYQASSKRDRGKILDEFVALANCHRKHAIRLLTGHRPKVGARRGVRESIYDDAVQEALIVLWETADRICGTEREGREILLSGIEEKPSKFHMCGKPSFIALFREKMG